MFNVTVLKMKDILKYFVGIMLTALVVIFVSKGLGKDNLENNNSNNNSNNIIGKLGKGINFFSKNSMLQALDETIPVISNVNEEYKNIAKEDDRKDENKNILQAMLGMQISSINGMENIENKENKAIEEAKEKNNSNGVENKNSDKNNVNNELDKNQTVAATGVTTEVITPNPISDGSNTQIRKCKNKK